MQAQLIEFKAFLDRRYPERSTTKHYMSDLAIFSEFIGEQPLETINVQTIDKFVQAQSEKQLKAATINRRLSAISSFFDFILCEEENEGRQNPVYWNRHSVRQGRHLPRDVSDDKIAQLFSILDDTRDQAMFSLMLKAGLRVGEVVNLTLDAIQAQTTGALSSLRVCGKGDKERMVWLTHETMHQLQQWIDERPTCENKFLFLNQHKRQLSVAGVQYRLKQYCETAGVQFTCHQLRHTFARRLTEQGMPIDSLAKLMGHTGIQTTQGYIDGANPVVRQDFMAAMSSSPPSSSAPPTATLASAPAPLPFVMPSPPDMPPSPQAVMLDIQHLAYDLPQWLQTAIQHHILRLMPRWSAHRAKSNAHNYFCRLACIGRWLVTHRNWQQLDRLQRHDLEAYVAARLEDGLKPITISGHLVHFRMFWRDLLDQERVSNGALLRVKPPKRGVRLPRYLTETEFHRLEQVIRHETAAEQPHDIFNRTWFYLLAHTGIRRSELRNGH